MNLNLRSEYIAVRGANTCISNPHIHRSFVLELCLARLLYWSMQASLRSHPPISIENHPNYRVVQVSGRSGEVGMLVPHANLVVPNKRTIYALKEIIQFYDKLKPSKPFNYGATSAYARRSAPPQEVIKPVQVNGIDDLPLFKKL